MKEVVLLLYLGRAHGWFPPFFIARDDYLFFVLLSVKHDILPNLAMSHSFTRSFPNCRNVLYMVGFLWSPIACNVSLWMVNKDILHRKVQPAFNLCQLSARSIDPSCIQCYGWRTSPSLNSIIRLKLVSFELSPGVRVKGGKSKISSKWWWWFEAVVLTLLRLLVATQQALGWQL